VRRVSHCGSKQQERSHAVLTVLLLVRATCICVLFFAHIPFVVNRTFSNCGESHIQQQDNRMNNYYEFKIIGKWSR